MPRLSVLLPVRDAAPTLEAAVESVLTQTWRDFELIAVDDHSTDASRAILERIAERDDRVRIIGAPAPGGIIAALRGAADAARGELLARMDADDRSRPARFERQIALLDDEPELAVVGCQVKIERLGEETGDGYRRYEAWLNACTTPEAIARERFIESPLAHPSVMMRRNACVAVGGYRDVGWAEDYDLWLRMIEAGHRCAKVPEVLLDWTDGPERLSRRDGRYSLENFQRAKAHFLARLPRVRRRGTVIWGAGPIGKGMARLLAEESVDVHAFVEVNPRQIGKTIHGIPVVDVENLTSPESAVHLAAVGQPGGRDEIRRCATELGLTEGEDLLCVA